MEIQIIIKTVLIGLCIADVVLSIGFIGEQRPIWTKHDAASNIFFNIVFALLFISL